MVRPPNRPPGTVFLLSPFLCLGLWSAPRGESRSLPQKPGLRNATGVSATHSGPKSLPRKGAMHGLLPGRGSEQEFPTIVCWSQQDASQWLMAGSAGVSAASMPVELSFSATTWYRLPVGGWQPQGPQVSEKERGEGERKGPGSGFVVPLSVAGCCECTLSRSNSFQINWAGYGGIWLLHRATKDSACAGAPDAFGTSPVLPGTIIFSNVFLPLKLRTVDFGMRAKCRFASSQIDMILDARCCTGAEWLGD